MDRARGYTMLELVVVLCVLSVLASVVLPLSASVADSMRLSALANTFLGQLHLARSEAIKRNAPVVVCKSRDGRACADQGGWEQGWIVFDDRDRDGLRGPLEAVVYTTGALPPGFRLVGNANVSRYVSFASTGATRTITGAFQAGTLTVCRASDEATPARQIVISAVGRPRVRRVTLANCR